MGAPHRTAETAKGFRVQVQCAWIFDKYGKMAALVLADDVVKQGGFSRTGKSAN
jgi:hypothetical protein